MEGDGRKWTIIKLILLVLFIKLDFIGRLWKCCWRKGRDSNPRYGCPHT